MTQPHITKYDYYLRLSVIIFAAISPFICLASYGYLPSLSSYWKTPLQPIFVFANAATAYYLVTLDNWKTSALFLILLTAFSVEYYNNLHNVLAIAFFILTIFPMRKTNNFKFCLKIYLSSLIFVPFSLLAAEIVAILAMCMYHGLSLNRLYTLQKERELNKIDLN